MPSGPAGRLVTGDGTDPGPAPEVLVLGPASRGWSTRTVRRVGVAVLVLALLIGLGDLTSRRLAAAEPSFAENEVVALYSNPGTSTPGELDWDPATVWVRHPEESTSELDITPAACSPLVSFGDLSDAVASVTVQLGLTDRRRMDANAGTLATLLFHNPASARARFNATVGALSQCSRFRASDEKLTLDEASAGDARRHRSDAAFRLAIASEPGLHLRVRLVRFGNTLTWSVTQDPPQHAAELPDRVVLGLQRAYRKRR